MSWLDRLMVLCMPLAPSGMVKPFAMRYVAGETLPEMLGVVRGLNRDGMLCTVDVLGEFIRDRSEAAAAQAEYLRILDALAREKLDANISVKLSQLGLLLDADYCHGLMRDLVGAARDVGNFVRIDMEDSHCTTPTIDLYLRLREEFSNVGIVLQAYLRRTLTDARRVMDAGAGHFRLCKGIYVEPRRIAYRDRELINRNYVRVLDEMFQRGAYVGIATHDDRLVWEAMRLIDRYRLRPDQYEFQMLLGVDPELRSIILEAGHRLRVYVPYGKSWHAYCMRRFKENPKLARYVLQNLFSK